MIMLINLQFILGLGNFVKVRKGSIVNSKFNSKGFEF